jgi:methionyl-tRNA synthetase
VEEEGGVKHTVLTGDYSSWVGSWSPSELPPGQKLLEPAPLFTKLDPGIVEEELRRLDDA